MLHCKGLLDCILPNGDFSEVSITRFPIVIRSVNYYSTLPNLSVSGSTCPPYTCNLSICPPFQTILEKSLVLIENFHI